MGLSPEHIAIINATAPVVGEHSLEITKTFYPKMFAENPEVFQYFNKANQASGRQPRALADAVVAYALNIERLEALGSAVNRMVNKHVALQVPPEGYDIVGKHLMWAIHEVLGDAITPEVHDAWVAAYTQLAEILKGAEANLYEEQKNAEGGWEGWREFTVEQSRKTDSGMAELVLKASDGKAVSKPSAGQYVSVHFQPTEVEGMEGEEYLAPRHYSIISSTNDTITICVRKVPDGVISNHIHNKCIEGSTVRLGAPVGCFTLDDSSAKDESPAVFIAGGIGFTPLLSMAKKVHGCGKEVKWIHSVKSEGDLKFSCPPVDAVVVNTSERPRLTAEEVLKLAESDKAHFYLCGPPSMIESIGGDLIKGGVDRDRVHYEMFGPHSQL